MAKILFLLLVAIAAVLVWRVAERRARRQDPLVPPPPPPQRMVRCAECEVYLPEGDAIPSNGRHFCCEAHRAAYAERDNGAH